MTILTELRAELERIYGERLVALRLYGSRARGEAGPDSDIDVMVVLQGPVRPGEEIDRTIEPVARISLENDVVISCVFVSAERFLTAQSAFMNSVRREGVAI